MPATITPPPRDLATLRRLLVERPGEPFLLHSPLPATEARLSFEGPFAGRAVLWDARVRALGPDGGPQYIDIGAPDGERVPVEIGLACARIDLPTLRKSVVMLRNYRRLRRGRLTFRGPHK